MTTVPHTIQQFAQGLQTGEWTCAGLTSLYLDGLERLNPTLRAMITITRRNAEAQAAGLDAERAAGVCRGPLHGVPVVNKDLFAVQGVPTTAGSPLFRQHTPDMDSAVTARLRAAGCVLLGQANMSEFAAVPVGRNKTYGDVLNPWNLAHSPGTSSSGSAAAVAAGLCLAATGSDTGNSVRGPAAYCGLTGLRPTHGLVSLAGAFPRAPSLDTAGVLTCSACDAALLLNCLAGYDPRDPHSVQAPAEDYTAGLHRGMNGLRVGIVSDFTFRDVDAEVAACLRTALHSLQDHGAVVRELAVPLLTRLSPDTLYELLVREFFAVLQPLYATTPDKEQFDEVIRDEMALGSTAVSAACEEAVRRRAQCRRDMEAVFADVDVLVTPTTPTTAPAYTAPPQIWRRQRQFLIPFSYLGLPALSVPCGLVQGLPVGLQIVGRPFSEALLLRVAASLESSAVMPPALPPVHRDSLC